MLMLLRTEMAGSNYQPQPDDIIHLCHEVIDTLTTGNPTRTIEFNTEQQTLKIDMDRKLIWRVLTNLFSNALKYSSEPVRVSLRTHDDNVEICVVDKGIGIPQAEQAQLFEPFFRANNASDIQGTGLGLTIVKQAVELHGGSVRIESVANMGTTITVTLPVLQPYVVDKEV
jgi:signal transduction histidine kinase